MLASQISDKQVYACNCASHLSVSGKLKEILQARNLPSIAFSKAQDEPLNGKFAASTQIFDSVAHRPRIVVNRVAPLCEERMD